MTTIAVDQKLGIMAVDTLCVIGNDRKRLASKSALFLSADPQSRLSEYIPCAIACTGHLRSLELFIQWMNGPKDSKDILWLDENDTIAMLTAGQVQSKGKTYLGIPKLLIWEGFGYNITVVPIAVASRFHSLGSGATFALSAMSFNQNVEQAIIHASRYDPYTNEKIESYLIRRTGSKIIRGDLGAAPWI